MKNFMIFMLTFIVTTCSILTFLVATCSIQPAHANIQSNIETVARCAEISQKYSHISKYNGVVTLEFIFETMGLNKDSLTNLEASVKHNLQEIFDNELSPEETYHFMYQKCIHGHTI